MPVKFCSLCGVEYWGRWGNTPAICETCALAVVVCPGCWTVKLRDADPAQLSLFTARDVDKCAARWRAVDDTLRDHFANTVPRGFDWESYTQELLSTRAAKNLEILDRPTWPRRPTNAERRKYPFH